MPADERTLVPHSPARIAVVAAAALALGVVNAPAHASSYGTPSIALSDAYLSGAVGATGDPTVTVTLAQKGADASQLTVAATKSSDASVAAATDVTVTGTGATRTVAVEAEGVGYADLTLKVTGAGGKTATTTLHYAASQSVSDSADTRYFTGAADASAAVDVGGGYTVVADDESNTLRLYRDDTSGAPVRTWDFDAQLGNPDEMDLEAAARVGDTVYWTGSMGNNKDGKLEPDRSTLFTTTVSGSGADTQLTFGGSYQGLRDDLIAWDQANGNRLGFAAGAAKGQIPKEVNGFNVEGLEFAPGSSTTAYLGFRAPLVPPQDGGKALLVPVTNIDQLAASGQNTATHATFADPIELDLGGLSVRDIRRNDAGQYLIVAGSYAADDPSEPYVLYSWDGVAGDQPVKLMTVPTEYGAWESVISVPDLSAPGAQVQLIQDDGSADLYGDGTEAKDLDQSEWQKSRTTWFTLNG
ncbi:DUF3616 domain-containing protein [Streptantibioticus parmotrematis]|uniref:DUF3616 domain-containing protein n=1 Tax=Streptantibioticus parmotrematis TaxID=2873249 RepID=UPI0035572BE0